MRRSSHHHNVYVIELHKDVLYERRFVAANPRFDRFAPCVYVGSTGLSPQARFENHRKGLRANRFVHKYGVRLMPEVYEVFNPMPYAAALELERDLAQDLRDKGWAVWQG
jgi:predicted GIY-YIG superfamily endonuclease